MFQNIERKTKSTAEVVTVVGEGAIERIRYDSYLRLYEKASLIKEWELK